MVYVKDPRHLSSAVECDFHENECKLADFGQFTPVASERAPGKRELVLAE